MSHDRSTRSPLSEHRRPDRLLKFMSQHSRGQLLTLVAALYAIPILAFGIVYWRSGVLSDNGRTVHGFWTALYFSLIAQITGGFLDIVTTDTLGRTLVSVQAVIGIGWVAFLPALILIRLTQPDVRSLDIGRWIMFNPATGQFAFRYASFSRLVVFHTDITVWTRVPAPSSGDYNNHPVMVRSHIQSARKFGNIRPEVPFLAYTDAADSAIAAAFPEDVAEIILHPAHLAEFAKLPTSTTVMIDIAGSTTVGPVHAFREFTYYDILCGSHVDVQPEREGPKIWENFNKYQDKMSTEDGRRGCLVCPYRPTCGLSNKRQNGTS